MAKHRTDSIYGARFAGIIDFQKITYKSAGGGFEIPAYLFAPIHKRGAKGHAAMVWVHGGVYGNWDQNTLPYVDMDRVGMMEWSHGGFIAALNAMAPRTPLKAAAAIVPVTNLVFRLSYKGPGYQRDYAAEPTIQGLPFEKPLEYIKRSPLYHVEDLKIPLLVHVATNDEDVNYVEDQQLVWKLRALKPDLAETKVYVDPPGWGASVGHAYSRRVDPKTLERVDPPEQIDSWTHTWAFFEWWLRPYEDRSKPAPRVQP